MHVSGFLWEIGGLVLRHSQKSHEESREAPLFSGLMKTLDSVHQENSKAIKVFGLFVAGYLFGFSVLTAIGLDLIVSSFLAIAAGLGVAIVGSLVGYLVLQTIILASLASASILLFRIDSDFFLAANYFTIIYMAFISFTPLLTLSLKVRRFVNPFEGSLILQLAASATFLFLVFYLRVSRPSDSAFALSSLYFGEDNAGIVDVLTKSLENGYSSHISKFGEFMNGVYLATAGQLGWFADKHDLALIAPLTHYNLTLIFMAWAPIAALCAIVLSGKKASPLAPLTLIFMSVSLILLMWPFINYGHTSVVTSGLFALCLLSVTLNKQLALQSPISFALFVASLGLIIGSTWFPFLPFAAVTVAFVFGSILKSEYKKGRKRTVLFLLATTALILLAQLPSLVDLVINDRYYLQLQGGTRGASDLLVILWLFLIAVVVWRVSSRSKLDSYHPPTLFVVTVSTLIGSNVYLFLTGIASNEGSPGYGATKYLITSIAFSLPLFWMLATQEKRVSSLPNLLALGAIMIFSILITQPDSRGAAIGFLSPPNSVEVEAANTGVVRALKEALEMKPEHVLCVSDFGYPIPGAEVRMESYFCTRWAQSLVGGDAESSGWRFVPLNRQEESYMSDVLRAYSDKEVVIIRFVDPAIPLLVEDTWWAKYIDPSWEIIEVKS